MPVRTVATKPKLDGILEEWGAPERIAVIAGGDRVGLRGAFTSDEDHEADVYLMWDADYIYAAIAVVDDVVDPGRIPPGENEWRGPSGERKDKMFYFDHLKIFLRGPERPLGHNIWLSPAPDKPYLWGGMQRAKPSEQIPVVAGSAMRDQVYTYEVAIPWTWLGFYPKPDMVLDALFLLPDSDLPGLEVRKKIRRDNKWVWWQGKIQLIGRPPGLKEKPVVEVIKEIAKRTREIVVPKVKVSPPPVAPVAAQAEAPAPEAPVREAETMADEAAEAAEPAAEVAVAARSASALRSRLNRRLLAKAQAPVAPDWVRALNDDDEISSAQVDSLYDRLTSMLERLTADNVNARTDGLVMDMAEYAGTWRAQAQGFLLNLLEYAVADISSEQGWMRSEIAEAALEAGVDGDKAVQLVHDFCRRTLKVYEEGKVALSERLVDKARRRTQLSHAEARAVLVALMRTEQ